MSFAWSKKLRQVAPAPPEIEVEQIVVIPTVDDKISVEEHKNGECLVSSREKDDEVGGGQEEVNGEEVVLPCVEDSQEELPQGEEGEEGRR